MKHLTRRNLLRGTATLAVGGVLARSTKAGDTAVAVVRPKFRLGIVTYNIAAQWDLPTLLGICKRVGLAPVELRTTHRHGVEPSIGKNQRQEVAKRFRDAGIDIWGCGTVCEFHSPDPAVVRKNV